MNRAGIVFESYNMVIVDCYDKFLRNGKLNPASMPGRDGIEERLETGLKQWSCTPLKDLDGMTPEEYFCSIQDFDHLFELFKTGSRICDEGLPKALVKRLKEYGDRAVDAMISIAQDRSVIDTDDIVISLMAIKVLGEWKEGRAAAVLADMLLMYEDEAYDVVREQAVDALAGIGLPALEHVLLIMETMLQDPGSNRASGNAFECLNSALAAIGKEHKSDRIYSNLKNAFLKAGSKYAAAACLGIYGDGRVIPFLRGYVEKNINSIDEDTFYEIKQAVESLGGSMDDIRIPRG